MTLKSYAKNVLKRLPVKIRHRINKAIALSLGADQGPVYNMFNHVEIIKKIGFDPKLIIDVGAYQGEWTKNVLEIFPHANFVMVEAQSSKSPILNNIANYYKNVSLEISLLGESSKDKVEFFEMETGSSIYEENSTHERKKVFLNMSTLDIVAEKYKTPGQIFLKIDVQGAEIDVLKGASDMLNNTEFILLEVSTLNYNQNAPQFSDVITFLKQKNFVLFDICDSQRTSGNILFQMDVLFVKENSVFRKLVDFRK